MYKQAYIHTIGISSSRFTLDEYNQAGNVLLSIGYEMKKTTLNNDQKLTNIRKHFSNLKKYDLPLIITDSGGYDIIKGDIPYDQINLAIDLYKRFLIDGFNNNLYDIIMSLDIPFFKREPRRNNYNTIRYLNAKSIVETIKLIHDNEDKGLDKKSCFVWQTSTPKRCKIWRELYDKCHVPRYFKRYALGGYVGIIQGRSLHAPPFVGGVLMLYALILKEFEGDRRSNDDEIHIHILGVYHDYSVFFIKYMENLLNIDLGRRGKNARVWITYDTINYTDTVLYKTGYAHDKIESNSMMQPDEDSISEIYKDSYQEFIMEIIRKRFGSVTGIQNKGNVENTKFTLLMFIKWKLKQERMYHDYIQKNSIGEELQYFKDGKFNKNAITRTSNNIGMFIEDYGMSDNFKKFVTNGRRALYELWPYIDNIEEFDKNYINEYLPNQEYGLNSKRFDYRD